MELTTSWQKVAETSYQVTSNTKGYLRLYMKYGNRDINNNRDTIYYEIRQFAYNPYGRYFAWQYDSAKDWSIKNGATVLANGNYVQTAIYSSSTDSTANEVVRASGNYNQDHNSDGSWSATLTLAGFIHTYAVSANGTVSLPTIPRASTVSVSNANIGSNTTIIISRKSNSFTHTLTYSFEGLTGTIATKTSSTSVTWQVPTSFYAKIPNAKSGTCTITCATYNGNTQVGNSTTDTFTATVNESSSQPVLTNGYSLAVSDNTSQTLTGATNKIISGYSTVLANLPVTVKNSATLSEYKVTNANTTKTTQFNNSFTKVTSNVFDIYVKDSRGFTLNGRYPYTLSNLTVLDYYKPTIKTLNIRRTEQTSTSVLLSMTGTYWNKSFGSTTNVSSIKYSYRWKLSSSSSWNSWSSWTSPTISGSNISVTDLSVGNNFSTDQSYDFQIRLKDALGDADNSMIVISTIQQVTKSTPVVEIADDYVTIVGDLNLNDKTLTRLGDYMKGHMTNDYTVQQAGTVETLPIDTYYAKVGNLTNSNNGIRIGAGIHTVLVSGNIYLYTNVPSTGSSIGYIYKNSQNMCTVNIQNTGNYRHLTLPTITLSVTEGDIIYLKINTSEALLVKNYQTGTFLNVTVLN